ncbi:hypothetical protein CMV_021647 [Castanea mollissima]|uniref:Uncharacterized protein n=1 Tax=Castanea mollissima TaxID=60419 RepID=A0A8J4QJH0_9ROSI|nr:hypothetical protein CMV_021647 [Castanea mollissima]
MSSAGDGGEANKVINIVVWSSREYMRFTKLVILVLIYLKRARNRRNNRNIRKRKNLDDSLPESQEWFPIWVWNKFKSGELGELTIVCGIDEKYRMTAERMMKVAFWCVQHRPESRPMMSSVVKMLEGAVEIPTSLNPFQHMLIVTPCTNAPSHPTNTDSTLDSEYSPQISFVGTTPVMRKFEIELATT